MSASSPSLFALCAGWLAFAGCASPAAVTSHSPVTAPLAQPRAVALDKAGNVYIGNIGHSTVVKISAPPAGGGERAVKILAGSTEQIGTTDGPGPSARFQGPIGLAVDSAGNIFVADSDNHLIRKISPAGVVTTVAGQGGVAGYADGPGPQARFDDPTNVAVDQAGNLYVSDNHNQVVRKISPAGLVTTLAGQAGEAGSADGTGAAARFDGPRGIAVDAAGNIYVAAQTTSTIRKITPDGTVSTLAGQSGKTGGDDGPGGSATFNVPRSLTVDAAGNVFVADTDNHTIRKITPAGVVSTVAGKADEAGATDGPGATARFKGPRGVAVDKNGNIYVADSDNDLIRLITPDGKVTTFAQPLKN